MRKKKTRLKGKLIIGLTGAIASGKKTALAVFKSLGAAVINADEIYKNLTKKDAPLNLKIAKIFGSEVLNENLSLNRTVLAKIVFNDKSKLTKLNKITHPAIIKEIKKQIKAAESNLIVLAASLLIEAKQISLVDEVWLIVCNKKAQIERLMKRDRFSRKEALSRINAQMPIREKIKFADVVIKNDGTKRDLKIKIVEKLNKNSLCALCGLL